MTKKAKIIELLEAAGKLYFYLYEYDNKQKNILTRGIDLLFCKDMSFLEKVLLVYARLTKRTSKRIAQIRIKYSNVYNYHERAILKTIFDSFGFGKFITLPFSEGDPNYNEAIECFFRNCREIFYKNHCRLDKLLDDNDVIIDGGASIGLFSLYAKNVKENVSCLVFEPEERSFKALKENLQDYKNVKFFNEALSDTVKEGELLISSNILMHRLNSELIDSDLKANYYDAQKVRLNTIDNVFFETNTKIDLIKLDIEGAELLALRGGVKTIQECDPLLLVAVDHAKKQRDKVIKFVRDHFEHYCFTEFTFLSYRNVLFYDPRKHLDRVRRL